MPLRLRTPRAARRCWPDPDSTGSGRRTALAGLSDAWLRVPPRRRRPDRSRCGRRIRTRGAVPGQRSRRSPAPHGARDGDIAAVADRVWYPVWDAGVRLDHSVRTLAEARRIAAEDLRAVLGLLDARHIAGDASADRGAAADGAVGLATVRAQAAARAAGRHAGNGGIARVSSPSSSNPISRKHAAGCATSSCCERSPPRGWRITRTPLDSIDAHDRLLDVRDALHVVTGRPVDRLQLQEQDPVAAYLGLLDADALLRRVCDVGRTVAYAADVTWRRVEQALVTRPGRRLLRPAGNRQPGDRQPLAPGAVEQNGEVVLARDARPERDPVLARCGWLPPQPRPGSRSRRTQSSAWPRRRPRCQCHGRRRRAMRWSRCLVPVIRPSLLGRPWIKPAWSSACCPTGPGYAAGRSAIRSTVSPSTGTSSSAPPTPRRSPDAWRDPTCCSSVACCTTWARAGRVTTPRPASSSSATWRRGSASAPPTPTSWSRSRCCICCCRTLRPGATLDDPATISRSRPPSSTTEVLDLLHALTEADGLATGPGAWNDWKAGLGR